MKKILYYFPRVLSILIVCFFAAFILEGLGPDFGWQDSLMHVSLALIALIVAILSWKKPRIGGWIFVAFGIWYLFLVRNSILYGGLIVGGIPLITGILFLIQGFKDRKEI